MHILYIAQRLPFPPNRGDRIPTYNHIRHLAQRHSVSVAALFQEKEEEKHLPKLKEMAAAVIVEYQSRWRSGLGWLRAFLSGRPISLGHFYNARLKQRVQALIQEHTIDAVVVFSSSMAQYVEGNARLIRVMNFCDVDSRKWADLAERHTGLKRWVFRREAKLLLAYERKIAQAFSASCVVTESEAGIFRQCIPGVEPVVVANGVDFAFFGATARKPADCELAFVGVMDYEPNVEAALFFTREVWPRLRERFPRARFNIVGARPVREIKGLDGKDGVTVTGFVEDVRDYLASATLVVIPLAIARGIQNKILEAMAAGVPVLTTEVGAAGFSSEARAALFLTEREPEQFLKAISALLADGKRMSEAAERARAFVQAHLSWESRTRVLEDLLLNLLAAGTDAAIPGKASR